MASGTQLAAAPAPRRLLASLALIGFTSVITQIVLLREFFVTCHGNELSLGLALAIWLFWTAVGSSGLGRWLAFAPPARALAFLQVALAGALPLSVALVRGSRGWWHAAPGESLGPGPILATAAVTLGLFCLLSGWLFVVGSRAYADVARSSTSAGTSATYLWEAIGSTLGGALASLVLIRYFDSLPIVIGLAVLNLLAALSNLRLPRAVTSTLALLLLAGGVYAIRETRNVQAQAAAIPWPGFHVVAARNSPYGSLAVLQTEDSRTLVQNGVRLFTVPDRLAAEEAVHFALLEHPRPRSVLLIGGGLNGSLAELLRHPTIERVDYVELDPAVLALGQEYFPGEWATIAREARIHTHNLDGRLFLKTTDLRFDVILLNLPEPQTAQLNRFYTEEFFREAADKLAAGGILAFQLHGGEEYLSPEAVDFLRCIQATVARVFPEYAAIPGEDIHFLATRQRGLLTTDATVLVQRLRERGIHTEYVREYYLPFRMAPERVETLRNQLRPRLHTRINRDFNPVAYYFSLVLWSAQFSDRYRDAFSATTRLPFLWLLAGIVLLLGSALTAWLRPAAAAHRAERSAVVAVGLMGLTVMGAEVLLLLGFQAIYGYVFEELAVIVAGFMAGLAMGSWAARRASVPSLSKALLALTWLQLGAALMPLGLVGALVGLENVASVAMTRVAVHALFPALALLCGLMGGYQFPVATRVFFGDEAGVAQRGAGRVYAADLAGAGAGAVLISGYLVPLFGFAQTALLLAVVNLFPAALSLVARHRPATVAVSRDDPKTQGT